MAVKLNDNALTTLDAVKELLDIPALAADADPAEVEVMKRVDNNLIRLINAASQWVETQTGRTLGKTEHIERLPGSGDQELVLQQWPIIEVKYVKDTTCNKKIPKETYDFTMTGMIGAIYKDDGWIFRGYRAGLANDYIASRRYLEVRYTAGYVLPKDATEETPATLPDDLQSVVWGIVEQEFSIRMNGAQGLAAFSLADVSWTFDKEPRPSWMATISRYARL